MNCRKCKHPDPFKVASKFIKKEPNSLVLKLIECQLRDVIEKIGEEKLQLFALSLLMEASGIASISKKRLTPKRLKKTLSKEQTMNDNDLRGYMLEVYEKFASRYKESPRFRETVDNNLSRGTSKPCRVYINGRRRRCWVAALIIALVVLVGILQSEP